MESELSMNALFCFVFPPERTFFVVSEDSCFPAPILNHNQLLTILKYIQRVYENGR